MQLDLERLDNPGASAGAGPSGMIGGEAGRGGAPMAGFPLVPASSSYPHPHHLGMNGGSSFHSMSAPSLHQPPLFPQQASAAPPMMHPAAPGPGSVMGGAEGIKPAGFLNDKNYPLSPRSERAYKDVTAQFNAWIEQLGGSRGGNKGQPQGNTTSQPQVSLSVTIMQGWEEESYRVALTYKPLFNIAVLAAIWVVPRRSRLT